MYKTTDNFFIFRNSLRKVFALIVLVLPLVFLSSAQAQTDDEIKNENEKLEQQAKENKNKKNSLDKVVTVEQKNVSELAVDLKALDLKVNQISSKVSAEQAKLNAAKSEVQILKEEATAKEKEIDKLEKKISEKAILGFQVGEIEKVNSNDPGEMLRMQDILESVTETQIEDSRKLGDLVVSLSEERKLAESLQKQIEGSKKLLEKDKAELEKALAAQQAAVQSAELALESRLAEAAVLAERDKQLANQIQENTQELAARAARRRGPASVTAAFTSPSAGEIVRVQGILVHVSISKRFNDLLNAAAADGINLGGWGYRDSSAQIRLRRQHCGTSHYAIYQMSSSRCRPPTARPGASQHERGLAIDFTYNGGSMGTRYNSGYKWLAANASKYGLYNLPSEPWHWSTTGN